MGSLLLTYGLTLVPAWHIYFDVWDEITYPFLNFNGASLGMDE